ncbi:RNA ligase family protein [Solitalea canadensis]|uniref:RNA ligase n=1 Tax=Solitalea canadensis (strain ATCC 29591 / DSM 3403 / JCM 21819 / LMG 8368 / NBRC 15130 / NCIMB 12057 / USAM 9D) TaxID=929556 RepID=H8KNX9_SOLCM|nr:RNA ligase family protein [Solitalea canadensis]AFD05390.1 RNA ligase [Solitalea canadensis DSM 3403]
MSISTKYGRTYHYPFSPGTTSDDRINADYWENIKVMDTIVHTEKLDGENNCLSKYGVFARSHAAPTTSPWTQDIRMKWDLLKNDLGEIELFGENLYAVHSIQYQKLEHHYYVFAVRCMDTWLSWEEVKFYAALFDFPTVPELKIIEVSTLSAEQLKNDVLTLSQQNSSLLSFDIHTDTVCTCEGIVSRNTAGFSTTVFAENVFKYVRKGHVKTDEHWTRNWKRAKLKWEYS